MKASLSMQSCDDKTSQAIAFKKKQRSEWPAALIFAIAAHLLFFTLALNSSFFFYIPENFSDHDFYELDFSLPSTIQTEATPFEDNSAESSSQAQASAQDFFEEFAEPAPFALESPELPSHKVQFPKKRSFEDQYQKYLDSIDSASRNNQAHALRKACYSGRSQAGTKAHFLEKGGGSQETESALLKGLQWLASVQSLDGKAKHGSWDSDGFMLNYLGASEAESSSDFRRRCELEGAGNSAADLGLSSLCLLAFSGAGYTREQGPFTENIEAVLDYIVRNQDQAGCFLSPLRTASGNMYDHALGLWALADYAAMSGEKSFHHVIKQALKFMLELQQPSGGWDYKCYPPAEQPERSDLSITGFCAMALFSAQAAGFQIPSKTFYKLKNYLGNATDPNGHGLYATSSPGRGRISTGMTAVNLLLRRLLGQSQESTIQSQQKTFILQDLPDYDTVQDNNNCPYQWYYAALALLLDGGEEWQRFNNAMKKSLLRAQESSAGPRKGSWPPTNDHSGKSGGRIYSTAIACLCLESYYRYIPEYLMASGQEFAFLWEN